jgi:hypothetical protein
LCIRTHSIDTTMVLPSASPISTSVL